MKKSLLLIIAVIFIASIILKILVYGVEEREIIAHSALLMDKKTGRVLWEKDGFTERAMASTTKIMTCIIALENCELDEVVTISKRAQVAPRVKLFVKEKEQYKLIDLLHALMLESSNDVAIAIAEHVGGSVEEFCELMTNKAHSIGAINTSYKTPNGLDADGHFTTAYDLAIITRYALNNEKFNKIINTPAYAFHEITKNRGFSVNNKNRFLNIYSGSNGVKTGFTCKAGYCFVGSATKNDLDLIVVVLGCGWPPNRSYRWKDTIKLMNYGFNNFQFKKIIEYNKIAFNIGNIKYAKKDGVFGIISSDLEIPCKEDEKIDVVYKLKIIEEAPIKKGDIIGEVIVYIDNEVYTEVDVYASKDVERINLPYCAKYVFDKFIKFDNKVSSAH
jgi:D-alanyl-D-alanine carboxypeptidase (penicillin-binding protein 5/6)